MMEKKGKDSKFCPRCVGKTDEKSEKPDSSGLSKKARKAFADLIISFVHPGY